MSTALCNNAGRTWWRYAIAALCFSIATLAAPVSALTAETLKGVALVIGNGDYEHLSKLTNPEHDANDVEQLLDKLGFDTTATADRDARRLKRDLEGFAEDAQGADVAVLYYSGHGIEAGGRNFLVPVDADLSSLDDAGENLVALDTLIDKLKAEVPVVIVMLDACRNNPFPADAVLKLSPDSEPQPIAVSGLGGSRSAVSMTTESASSQPAPDANLGMVLAFAAEPGKVALDGEPGKNSPYAAALLRHLSAMSGDEFGMVMRMVAEEVYLKTQGQQRPWVNESMRRLLYLGQTPDHPTGAEGDILTERRGLLVTIAALPDRERKTIETIASADNVPMDALYGMLKALGADAPKDPAQLEKVLREQVAAIKKLQSERATLKSQDPEIVRLSSLAGQAASEGALQTAIQLHEQAKARVRELEDTVAGAEANVKARRLEFAEVYAASGQANQTLFNFEQAAADYEQAFIQVDRWDDYKAWMYRGNQAQSLQRVGWRTGNPKAIRDAEELARDIARRAAGLGQKEQLISQAFLGNTLLVGGQRLNDFARLEEASKVYEDALKNAPDADPEMRAEVLHNLAAALSQIAKERKDPEALRAAIAHFDEITQLIPHDANPAIWARTIGRQAMEMTDLARQTGDRAMMQKAADQLAEAAPILRDDAKEWRNLVAAQAIAVSEMAILDEKPELFRKSAALFDQVLPFLDRRDALEWANVYASSGISLHHLGFMTKDAKLMQTAIARYRTAMETLNTGDLLQTWLFSQTNIAGALGDLGRQSEDMTIIAQSTAAHREALAFMTPAANPEDWPRSTSMIGENILFQAKHEHSLDMMTQALAAQTDALQVAKGELATTVEARISEIVLAAGALRKPDFSALMSLLRDAENAFASRPEAAAQKATVQQEIGRLLYSEAIETKSADLMGKAVGQFLLVIDPATKAAKSTITTAQSNLGLALRERSRMIGEPSLLKDAAAAFRAAQRLENRPGIWENNQRNLAAALNEMAAAGDYDLYRDEAGVWAALEKRLPPERPALDRALVAENRAISLQNFANFAASEKNKALVEAVTAYRLAFSLFEKTAADSADRRRVTESLADIEHDAGSQLANPEYLSAAAERYAGLEQAAARSKDLDLVARAGPKRAAALASLAAQRNDPAAMREAAALFKAAVGADMVAYLEHEWSSATMFARTLRNYGYAAKDEALMREAMTINEAALQLPDTVLSGGNRLWIESEMADSLNLIGDRLSDPAMTARSVEMFRKIVDGYKSGDNQQNWRNARAALASTLIAYGKLGKKPEALAESATIFRDLMSATQPEANPGDWAYFANAAAYAATMQSRAGDANVDMAEIVELSRAAVRIFERAGLQSSQAEETLCGALTEHGRQRREAGLVEQALTACDRALTVFRQENNADLIAEAEASQARANALLKELWSVAQ